MKLLSLCSYEYVIGYRYRLGRKNFPNLTKKVVAEPIKYVSSWQWLKLTCNGKFIRRQKDLSKFFKRIMRAYSNRVNPIRVRNKTKYLVVNCRDVPQILRWGVRFLSNLDEVNIQSLSNCLLRLKLFDNPLYKFTCKTALSVAYNMEYSRLLSIILSLSKLRSIYQGYDNEYLHPLVICASERLIKEEVTGNHLGLLCQALYYCKLFSQDFMKLILPISDQFLSNDGLTPENINSIYGYISLYPQSHNYICKPRVIFMSYISKSMVDAKNILKFLKINHNRNIQLLKRISITVLSASIDELSTSELLDLMVLYTNCDNSSIGVLIAVTNRLDWLIDNIKPEQLTNLLYYICKLYVIDTEYLMFKRHLQLALSRAISNIYNGRLDITVIVRYIDVFNRVGGDSKFICNTRKTIGNLMKHMH
ncbi:hypothetical protein BMR1_03g01410 [Babesia microti strain RI]|uniref:Uncharacterized protein n=1 Tax=Babesia microti (strain RI) TaxID=1133968 RepID=A0A1R4ABI9_BABMR|nr:hypothetical protein BMR1_03g01410 [Babesia microti strain RI]SJK86340.1 hypothetical protein BMR1_03g01410 [Babesia microti strain RI]|eukprot:XP_021338510.1 hypothetical protein BMR1_03g01410 [Babesia microti strain RI]